MNKKQHRYKHNLVCLGDSITQGFQNSAIYRTELSIPAFLAAALNPKAPFHLPKFSVRGGIPLNLDFILRALENHSPNQLNWKNYPTALAEVYAIIRKTKKYWEGREQSLAREVDQPWHNQSVWGFTLNDAWMLTDQICRDFMATNTVKYSIFNFLPDHALYTTARCVLNPTFQEKSAHYSLLDNVETLSRDGGIDTLLVNLGSNHVVGAVTKMNFRYSEGWEAEALPFQRVCTVLRAEHFALNFKKLTERIKSMNVNRVVITTIPYVTIPPVSQGLNLGDPSVRKSEYFDYYAQFWISDDQFNPDIHKHLTREDAINLDNTVDYYNQTIKKIAEAEGWILVDMNRAVQLSAYRRHQGRLHLPMPQGLVDALKKFQQTSYLVGPDGQVKLDTRYFKTDPETHRITEGGLFSLDGLHPTTVSYGIMANLIMEAMKSAGVRFESDFDWEFIVQNDTLIFDPPVLLKELRDIYKLFAKVYEESKKLNNPDQIVEPLFGFWRNLKKVLQRP